MSEKDIAEKNLEAYNDVFADIVNGLLFDGKPIVTEEALTDAQPYSMYKADGNLHEQERDVSKYWNDLSRAHRAAWPRKPDRCRSGYAFARDQL